MWNYATPKLLRCEKLQTEAATGQEFARCSVTESKRPPLRKERGSCFQRLTELPVQAAFAASRFLMLSTSAFGVAANSVLV